MQSKHRSVINLWNKILKKKEVMNYDNDAEDPGKEVQERFYTR